MKAELSRNYLAFSLRAGKAALLLGAYLGFFFVFWAMLSPQRVALQVGQVSPRGIKAPFDIVDVEQTEELRRQAAAQVKEVYDSDPQVAIDIGLQISRTYQRLKEVKQAQAIPPNEKLSTLKAEFGESLPEEALKAALEMSESELDYCQVASNELMSRLLEGGITPEALPSKKSQLESLVSGTKLSSGQRLLVSAVVKAYLRPNMFLNALETQRRRDNAVAAVEPVKVLKDMWIIREGDVVTQRHIDMLRAAGLLAEGANTRPMVASALYSGALLFALVQYVRFFEPKLSADQKGLVVLIGVSLGAMALSGVLMPISVHLSPVPAAALLVANLLGKRLGLVVGVLLSCAVNFATETGAAYAVTGSLAVLVGVSSITRIGHRYDLISAGLKMGVVNALSSAAHAVATGKGFGLATAADVAGAIGNGIFSAFVVLGVMPFLEAAFGMITPLRLLELANPNHPLLLRLLHEAPGTYHHSVMVANLAESATEAIGGNSLLARVGAYYHDVGKLRRPYFFIENQMGDQDNPHDKISPALSKMIITSHVKDGVELAKEYRLPGEVVSFIREHHGTTLVSYFFNKACDGANPIESDFRYEGPKPHSKETALVMLADSVEAAVRSLPKATPTKVENVVKKIFEDRLCDHQLDECDLTLSELGVAASVFIKILTGMFHQRVEYPAGNAVAGEARG
ncbi:MAG: HD family phosphohydrolase [Bacillota bacterium]